MTRSAIESRDKQAMAEFTPPSAHLKPIFDAIRRHRSHRSCHDSARLTDLNGGFTTKLSVVFVLKTETPIRQFGSDWPTRGNHVACQTTLEVACARTALRCSRVDEGNG
ncbi:uncharacterized protein N7458_008746 [Penicillium daleae]|uniref:Uncharacterized protein n=1 Tax=Penicillium daleae TaxID=63821 RepID=A0AAD6BVA8_9EURO|nr:uncharacterized protein N7458_008746 [Penicillium daleae]KAJ5437748.1 hypothetical protein N7458_008746 [Penicillium daleae]